MKRLLSLFDLSGKWPSPFMNKGWDVITWDIQNGQDIYLLDSMETLLDTVEHCDGVLAACPCTHFTKSSAWMWKVYDQDGRTLQSMSLVEHTLKIIEAFTPTDPDYYDEGGSFFWAIENPAGRINRLFPELGTGMFFHPYEYAGHLNLSDSDHNELDRIRMKDAKGVTVDEAIFVMECNAYKKQTGLWGDFNPDLKKDPIEPVRCCKAGSPLMVLGGSSIETKNIRSMTPVGFATAFCEANQHHVPQMDVLI